MFYGTLDVIQVETTTIIVEGDTETEITIDGEGGEGSEFKDFGVHVPIYVFGAQISAVAQFNQADTGAGGGAGGAAN